MKPIEKSTPRVDPLTIQRDMTMWVASDLPDRTPSLVGDAVERSRLRMERELQTMADESERAKRSAAARLTGTK